MATNNSEKVMLLILDGWGKGTNAKVDAIAQAKTPCYDSLLQNHPNANLVTYGSEVGLPAGQMGNSEVGHLNIGAGRVVYQELARINKAIKEDTLMKESVIQDAISYAKEHNKKFHLLYLLSDGGVHSHIDHLTHIMRGLQDHDVNGINVHAIMDGRDTDPEGGLDYMKELLSHIDHLPNAQVATIIGRYYAMDRDTRWERTKLAYDMLVHGLGESECDPLIAIERSYASGITDEFMEPHVIDRNGLIEEGDVVFFANFRTDRPRQLTTVLTQRDIPEEGMSTLPLHFVTMTEYDQTYEGLHVVYRKDRLKNTLGEVLEVHGKSQVRIAETEKYPHVTFFFSGGREEPFAGEDRILLPSPKVATYDLQPEMSAREITQSLIAKIESDAPDFICLNFANTDMVGHTGVWEAALTAAETVDSCVAELLDAAKSHGYHTIIIADHGNSDYMINDDGSPNTAHTTNLVPIIYVSPRDQTDKIKDGKLADVAPTILSLMGIERPVEMTGEVLIEG